MALDIKTLDVPSILDDETFDKVRAAVNLLVDVCHGQSFNAGWWDAARLSKVEGIDPGVLSDLVPTKLMLCVSELAEGMEGHRKGLKDDHLPQHEMLGVELGDAMIRELDLAGAHKYDFGLMVADKLLYNATRPDHKREARAAPGGKTY